ncbi:DUF2177 family protein [Rhizobiaceae bacterium n13]|uniref:DUF2177 family protein n=1 Tax=Ferirhizobium litorale TaxID=2927786 RepID=A0AAE3QF59_9HYPH|nr:DUF2177 family protein [Fererhizobium litorale]MDI7862621.1 DUF2177 family protein [Fererhizobium litorale]MDI7923896.1 DUF2177 family protein [Fererhizobium litorale]
MTYFVSYIATAIVFLGVDFVWLSRVTPEFYRSRIGDLMLAEPNFIAAGLFYLFYVAGIVYFAVVPALNNGSWHTAMLAGALLGLVAYGTYDVTNLAVLKNWSLTVTIVDMLWGTVLTSVSATIGYLVTVRVMAGNS